MGDCHGSLRFDGRDVSKLCGVAGGGPDYSSRRVCGGLSSAAGSVTGCLAAVAEESRQGTGGRKSNDCDPLQEGRVIISWAPWNKRTNFILTFPRSYLNLRN